MSKQALVDHAVKQCYQEFERIMNGEIPTITLSKKPDSAKAYTVAWFSVWWNDVKMIELTRAIEKAESENVVQP